MSDDANQWWIFRGDMTPHDGIENLPAPPPWRRFSALAEEVRDATFLPESNEIQMVNAAMYLRRPLLITGRAGIGKTTLAYSVAKELKLGRVLRWSVTTQSTLRDALYRYDAVGRLQESALLRDRQPSDSSNGGRLAPDGTVGSNPNHEKSTGAQQVPINKYLRLGPLGTAIADSKDRPRVLLIDEIDKGDVDLPNDLLHLFEEGEFEIPELARLPDDQQSIEVPLHESKPDAPGITVKHGRVSCTHFPIVFLTSNGERRFPPAFVRRCLQLEMDWPRDDEARRKKLADIVRRHLDFAPEQQGRVDPLVDSFVQRLQQTDDNLATDQLLNAIYLVLKNVDPERSFADAEALLEALWRPLNR